MRYLIISEKIATDIINKYIKALFIQVVAN